MSKDKELRQWGINIEDMSDGTEVETTEVEIAIEEVPVNKANRYNRKLTNEDVLKYEPMVEKYIRDNVAKNWNEADTRKGRGDVALGNTGLSLNDIRQQLRTEVCVALYNYNPDYRTKDGRSVKESTFVFQHLFNRCGQMMKRLTKKRYGYGVWHANIEETLWETDRE